jgi:hypothetical protein
LARDFRTEAELFGRHLLGVAPNNFCISLYIQAMEKLPLSLDPQDQRVLQFMMRRPWSIAPLDAGLAVLRNNSAVRRMIYTMLAILETSPEYCDRFLPRKRSRFYLLYLAWVGLRAVGKACAGGFLLQWL